MSITATVENDTIKLPIGVHLPDGTPVRIEAFLPQDKIQTDDPIFHLHEGAATDPNGPMTDREMDQAIYGR